MKQINLYKKVFGLVKQIPEGSITTYKAIAIALGDEIAARAVGGILHTNKKIDEITCYRVVNSDSTVGGYVLGTKEKIRRLDRDGIKIKDDEIQDFEKILFSDFKTDYPLKKLRQEQSKLKNRIKLEKLLVTDNLTVAGIDVSYQGQKAKGVYVLLDKNFEILEQKTIICKINFPYIPTYLSYRELSVILKLMRLTKNKPDILMIDGNGILHPLRMGIATHAGILLNTRTIGVAKSLLSTNRRTFGASYDLKIENNFIKDGNEIIGFVLGKNYISPGHKTDLGTSIEIVKLFMKNKQPEPIRLAHNLSRF